MSVWIRRTVVALGALVLVVVALAVWLVSSFEPDRHKGVAIDWMKANRNRTLAIDGPIKLSLFPRLEVRLSRITLSEAGRADEFASLAEANLAVEVLPLLRGELSVDRVHASGVRLMLLRDAKGRRNIDDLVRPGTGAADAPASGTSLRFAVSSIDLSDVRARIKDEPAGLDGELLLKEFSTGRIANQVASKVKLLAQLGFKSPALKGELSGSCVVTPDFDTGSLRLADMSLSYKGDAPAASSIDASVRGELAYDAAKGALDAKALQLRVSANTGALKLVESTLNIGHFAREPASKRIAIEQLQLRIKGTQSGRPLELDLDWPELDVRGDTLKGSPLTGRLALAGDLPLAGTFRSGAPSGNFDSVRIPAFELHLAGDSTARKIDGALRSDLVLQPDKSAITLDKLGAELKLAAPPLKPMALSLQGQVGASAQSVTWNLAGQVNANGFTTEGNASLAHTTPNIKAQVRFETLDLNSVLPAPQPASRAAATDDGAVDLSVLRSVNGSVSLRANSIVLRQYRVGDARLEATLEAGVLRAGLLQGRVWGGAVDATALADARASRVALKATANGVNVNALLKDVAGKDLLEGNGQVSVDFDTAGRSGSELKSRLKGSAALRLRDGAIKGINLARSLRQAKAALSGRQDAAQKASQTEKTDFSELSATFQIGAGVARNRDLEVKSPYLRLGGEGSLDIAKGRIDYTARATVTDTSKGQDGAELAALKGLTVPVQLSGPFDAIDWKIQWTAVAAGAVKNQLEGKLKERLGLKPPAAGASAPGPQQKVQDKLKDKLEGLFK
jgi:AsmA protein